MSPRAFVFFFFFFFFLTFSFFSFVLAALLFTIVCAQSWDSVTFCQAACSGNACDVPICGPGPSFVLTNASACSNLPSAVNGEAFLSLRLSENQALLEFSATADCQNISTYSTISRGCTFLTGFSLGGIVYLGDFLGPQGVCTSAASTKTPASTVSTTSRPAAATTTPPAGPNVPGIVIGTIVGTAVVVAAIVLLVLFFRRRRQYNRV